MLMKVCDSGNLKGKMFGSLSKYPSSVYKFGTWPTCGMQAKPVGVTSGIHAPGTWPTCDMQAEPVGVTSGIHVPIYAGQQ